DQNVAASESRALLVSATTGPRVVAVRFVRGRRGALRLQLSFDGPLAPASSAAAGNYLLFRVGGPRGDTPIGIDSATYDPSNFTVTLATAHRLATNGVYRLSVNGTPPRGLTSPSGVY